MAVEQGKVMAKLNEILKGKSVTENYKKALATRYAAKIETDDDIDTFIEDRKDDILDASKEADRRTTQAVKAAKEEAAKVLTGAEKKDEPENVNLPEGATEFEKFMMSQMKEMSSKIQGFEAAKSKESLAERFSKVDGFDKIPKSILNRFVPQKEEDFDSAKEELAKTWGEIAPKETQQGRRFGVDIPAGGAAKTKATDEGKPDEAVMAFAKAQNDKFLNSQKN